MLYASVALAFLTFCATNRMFDSGGLGVLAWLALLGICSYGVYWVWTQYRVVRLKPTCHAPCRILVALRVLSRHTLARRP